MGTNLLGIDPGFASVGWSVVHRDDDGELTIYGMGVIRTQKSTRMIPSYIDNVERAARIGNELDKLIDEHCPDVICAEAMSFSRNASSSAKVTMTWGVLVHITQVRRIPMVQVQPQQIKMAVCGRKNASKTDVEIALGHRCPDLYHMLGQISQQTQQEHAIDALGAVIASLDDNVVIASERKGGE